MIIPGVIIVIILQSNQNHSGIEQGETCFTLPAAMGEGGGHIPMIVIEGNGSRPSHYGNGYKESEEMFTLNTTEVHGVAYAVDGQNINLTGNNTCCLLAQHNDYKNIPSVLTFGVCSYDSNSMKSSNPFSGFYEAKTARTLDNNGGNPACNQGGVIIIEHNPHDSRTRIALDQRNCQTLAAYMGGGGNNVPLVMVKDGDNETHNHNISDIGGSACGAVSRDQA